jgi:hypothetical protein
MTSPVIKTYDCVTDSTTTSGAGTVTLAGVATQSNTRAVSAAATTGDVVAYKLTDGSNWEVGYGTLTSGTNWTLTRNLLYSSTGSLLSLSGGTTQVWLDAPAALLLSVFQQGIQGNSNIVPAGSNQAGATAIVSPLSVVVGTANGQGVMLPVPPAIGGSPLYFIDNSQSSYTLLVYPNSAANGGAGGTIDGLSANAPITLQPGATWIGWAQTAVNFSTAGVNIFSTNGQVGVSYTNGGISLSTPTRVFSEASNSAPAPNCASYDIHKETALSVAPTIGAPSGTPSDGQVFQFILTDNGTARALSWNSVYAATSVALPTTTVASTPLRVTFQYSTDNSKWNCIGVA